MMASSSTSSSTTRPVLRPILLVTGANSGVGFGTCQRLLLQLANPTPTDTLPFHPDRSKDSSTSATPSPFSASEGCTLILACRNAIKAHKAVKSLQVLLNNLEALDDNQDLPKSTPGNEFFTEGAGENGNGTIDEDSDAGLIAQAQEASLRRRKNRFNVGVLENQKAGWGGNGEPREEEVEEEEEMEGAKKRTALEEHEFRQRKARGQYRRRFCRGTKIEFVPLDLGSMASALICAKEVTERHGYLTHVILNAGTAAFTGIDWPLAIWMCCTNLHRAVTYPKYKTQRSGDVGEDGYGWVWQANCGAHFILVRALLPALRSSPYSTPSRIIWTGSIEAMERYYITSDPQCIDPKATSNAYESTKYQCELAGIGLDKVLQGQKRMGTQPGTPASLTLEEAEKKRLGSRESSDSSVESGSGEIRCGEPRSFVVHPGVVASSIFVEYLTWWMIEAMRLAFYIARWTFSPNHPIEAFKGGVAASHVSLAPLQSLDPEIRYGSCCDVLGREYVSTGRLDGWDKKSINMTGSKEVEGEGRSHVLDLAREVVERCEEVAKRVWREAKDGQLVPFKGMDGDGDKAKLLLPKGRKVKERERRSSEEKDDWEKVEGEI